MVTGGPSGPSVPFNSTRPTGNQLKRSLLTRGGITVMLNGESHWKIEQYFFWPILILMIVITIAGVTIALVARDRQNDFDREETNWFVAIWSACWVIIIGLMLIG